MQINYNHFHYVMSTADKINGLTIIINWNINLILLAKGINFKLHASSLTAQFVCVSTHMSISVSLYIYIVNITSSTTLFGHRVFSENISTAWRLNVKGHWQQKIRGTWYKRYLFFVEFFFFFVLAQTLAIVYLAFNSLK